MQAYSQDLRERVLRAIERGEGPTDIARRYEVSRMWVYQVGKRLQATGERTSYQVGGQVMGHLRSGTNTVNRNLSGPEWRPRTTSGVPHQPGRGGPELPGRAHAVASQDTSVVLRRSNGRGCLSMEKGP
jgi:hypothetical protein